MIAGRSSKGYLKEADNIDTEVKHNGGRLGWIWHDSRIHFINPAVFARGKILVFSYRNSDTSDVDCWLVERHLDLNRTVIGDCGRKRPRRSLERFDHEINRDSIGIRQHCDSSEIQCSWRGNGQDVRILRKGVIIPKGGGVAINRVGWVIRAHLAIHCIWRVVARRIGDSSIRPKRRRRSLSARQDGPASWLQHSFRIGDISRGVIGGQSCRPHDLSTRPSNILLPRIGG